MNFGELKANILSIIGRAPADVCYELTTADINQRLRLLEMQNTQTSLEAAAIALPNDFLGIVDVYRDTNPRTILRPVTAQQRDRIHDASGTPHFYAITDGQMTLTPEPSGTENIQIRYFAKLANLSADTDENFVLTNYPSIYVYGALAHHSVLIQDQEQQAAYASAFERAIKQAQADDNKKRFGGDSPKVSPRAVA